MIKVKLFSIINLYIKKKKFKLKIIIFLIFILLTITAFQD